MVQALALALALAHAPALTHVQAEDDYVAGYMIIPPSNKIDRSFNAGFSMYVAVWPLLGHYPGHRFQTGLPGTWMFAQYEGSAPKDMYSDVEGGLGWWTDTRFPTETPKFIMGGVGPNFSEIANGPAHGAGSWEYPRGLYGVAQLSPWLLFPIDGLNLKQGTCGEFLGYGYLKLPLTERKKVTDGVEFPTGNNSWTLFLNAHNFKGPVAFFTPHFWSHSALKEPRLKEQLLDSRPVDPNTALQMETQYIPCKRAVDSKGEAYIRIAPTSFPRNAADQSALMQQNTAYNTKAIWDDVSSWFAGGPAVTSLNPAGSSLRTFRDNGYMTWEVHSNWGGKEKRVPIDWKAFATPTAIDAHTFGAKWDYSLASKTKTPTGDLVTFPEYFHLVNADQPQKACWIPVKPEDVPSETGLQKLKWERPVEERQEAYRTPMSKASSWKTPGPAAGPFKAHLGDGTVVTYYWYKFIDQPALLNADLTPVERAHLQARVEKLHRAWPKNHNYLAPPARGKLADLDPAQIVKPPKGLEYGYVPIATHQDLEKR